METELGYDSILQKCANSGFLNTRRNDMFLAGFMQAKVNGGYGRLVFEKGATPGTAAKKARNLAKIDDYFRKDFDTVTEDELLKYRDLLNNDKVFCNQTFVTWEHGSDGKSIPSFEVRTTDKPLSYRTKEDYIINFREFYKYMVEAHYQENKDEIQKGNKRELVNITRYFVIRRPADFNLVNVQFIPDNERERLLGSIKNKPFKALVQLCLMSGARPCEVLKIRYGPGHNLYKNNEGKWTVHLPKIKRVSYAKFAFVIDMYQDELYPYFDGLTRKSGDLVFTMTYTTANKLMRWYSEKYVGKRFTLKILRKTARMIRTNARYSHDWINKLMGHSPGSKVQAHYMNYDGIMNEPEAQERLKDLENPSIKQEYSKLKLEMQAQQIQLEKMRTMFLKTLTALETKKAKKKLDPEIVKAFLQVDS